MRDNDWQEEEGDGSGGGVVEWWSVGDGSK